MGALRTKLLGMAVCLAFSAALAAQQPPPRVELITSHHGRTPALRDYVPGMHAKPNAPFHIFPLRKPGAKPGPGGGGGGATWTDPDLQTAEPAPLAAIAGTAFAGIAADGYVPPDPNLSVSLTQLVETTNVEYAVYDKSGNVLLSPAALHTIWMGGLPSTDLCATTDGGDPIVLWDKPDQRWIVSQLAYNNSLSQNEWCMAVSTTSDATGSYDVYSYAFGGNLPDYPKLGVWTEGSATYSGIYFSANIFAHGNTLQGADFCALPLVSSGRSLATLTCVLDPTAASVLPADLEGATVAPNGTGDFYLDFSGSNTLNLFQLIPDFANPGDTLFVGPTAITVNTFHEACKGGACVPQSGTREKLDSLGDRLMYRLSYRNYGGYDALVVNQSVQVSSSSNQTGVRWYEITNPGSSPNVAQQSVFSPDTILYRWMGSIAQDKMGDLGLGYSTSSSSTFPSVAFTGQQAGDPPNTMEAEATIHIGTSYQSSVNRWGDYSSVSLDPSDDCTFWYVNEYLRAPGNYTNWETYIGSYKFPICR